MDGWECLWSIRASHRYAHQRPLVPWGAAGSCGPAFSLMSLTHRSVLWPPWVENTTQTPLLESRVGACRDVAAGRPLGAPPLCWRADSHPSPDRVCAGQGYFHRDTESCTHVSTYMHVQSLHTSACHVCAYPHCITHRACSCHVT